MRSHIIRALLVEADAEERRWVQRALAPSNPVRKGENRWRVEQAATFHAARRRLKRNHVDVILVGLRSKDGGNLQRLIRLREIAPHLPVVAFSGDESVVATACALGATETEAAKTTLSDQISALVLNRRSPGARDIQKLTPRERQIIQLIAEGRSTKEVAQFLGISVKTAETHRTNLKRKLGLRSVSELVRYAIRNNIVEA